MVINYNLNIIAFAFIVFDIVTGVLASMITGTFKSSRMREGGKRKLFLLVVIGFGAMLDYAQYMADIGMSIPANATICGYIALMEIMSIVENINIAYPNALPKALTNVLYKSAEDKGVKTEDKKDDDKV